MKKLLGLFLLVFLGFFPSVFGSNIDPSAITCLPNDIAVDASGTLYITDACKNLYKMTPNGILTNLIDAEAPRPTTIVGVAVDKSGNIYVADADANLIWKITSGGVWTVLAGSKDVAGAANGTGTAASFNSPHAVAVDRSGNVYVADENNNLIRKITRAGVVTTLAGAGTPGYHDGIGTAASFSSPEGIAVDRSGNVYVADQQNDLIRKITPRGLVTTLAGSGTGAFADGTGTAASFHWPTAVALDKSGNVYVADSDNSLIRKITPRGVVTTLAGSGTDAFADGTGTAASFHWPSGVAVDRTGNVYVADRDNISVRKISSRGVVTTVAGSIPGAATSGSASTGAGVASSSLGSSGTATSRASSGPITLVCVSAVGKSDPAQLILDESAGTADFSSDAVTTATFTDTKVFWKVDSQDTFYPYYYYQRYYDLSRLTGLLTLRVSKGTGDTNGNVIWVGAGGTTYNCKIGVEKKMF